MDEAHDTEAGTAIDAGTARTLLQDADDLTTRTSRQLRWWVLFMAVFAVGFGALTLLVGTADGPRALVAPMVAFGVLTIGMVGFARSRPVQGGVRLPVFLGGWVGTTVLYGVALWVGLLTDWPLWGWVAASVVVAVPLTASAWLTYRSLR